MPAEAQVRERTAGGPAGSPAVRVSIELDGVSKVFSRDDVEIRALERVDLRIRAGEFVSIVGPSGCGKSTLMRIVAGLIPASGGTVRVQGGLVERPQTDLGIVFQSPVLLDWRSVLGNVMLQIELRGLDRRRYQGRARELLAAVGLAEFADSPPRALSGGMKQRAAIVRALVHDPSLLLMDEPFGALDALTREQMRIDLEELWRATRKTVLFITHSIDEAVLLSDRVVVMSPRPGAVERVIEIDLPRPRGLEGRKSAGFAHATDLITRIFLERGVLHGARPGLAASLGAGGTGDGGPPAPPSRQLSEEAGPWP